MSGLKRLLDQGNHFDGYIFLLDYLNRIAQRPAESLECDLHHIPILQFDPLPKLSECAPRK